ETTQAQYQRLMGNNPSLFQDASRPVECVSWNDAVEFCRRLTESEKSAGALPRGVVYRLPTAQEFDEFGGVASPEGGVFSDGDTLRWHTAPVGTLPPNPHGLHDVFGNVWEWCDDWSPDGKRYKIAKG